MCVVLVCLSNFQEYILTNIQQLIRLGHEEIYILTNTHLFTYFNEYLHHIKLIYIENLHDNYNFLQKCNMDASFRGGFWALTSMRFFYIYAFMVQYQINDIIHLENDVLIYYNCDVLLNKVNKNYLYLPFDNLNRNVASIMYIPNADVFKQVLDNYSSYETDMKNFVSIKEKTGIIQNFPIFCEENSNDKSISFVSNNFNCFEYIFDAAAIGQYLGGIYPRNNPNFYSTGIHPINNDDYQIGFVNPDCIVKYDNYDFKWKVIDDIKRPFVIIDSLEIPIFNIHIHSKKLQNFI